MSDAPWLEDACSLVDAYRKKTISPLEAVEACYGAIEASALNAVTYVDRENAVQVAKDADVSLPFGGVPVAVKELDPVKGWPFSQASLVFEGRIADHDSIMVERLKKGGIVPLAQTAASEFGGINMTYTKLHGATHNPWKHGHTPGGSSGGTAAGVAGGLFPLGTAGDGGGSIRIPAAFTGMFGLKSTFGRIPNGPITEIEPLTVVFGCVSRSVRDTARWFDVCNGQSEYDPFSLPRVEGWEAGLGTFLETLRGKRVVISPNLGSAHVARSVQDAVHKGAERLIDAAGLSQVDVPVHLPAGGLEWAMAGMTTLLAGLGDKYPECEPLLTPEIMFICNITQSHFNADSAKGIELYRKKCIHTMAEIFENTDFIITATNPDIAFPASGPLPTQIDDVDLAATFGIDVALGNNGALTIPCNTTGNPAITLPVGTHEGLPIGMQVIGRHHAEQLLLDVASCFEKAHPWPLVAPGAPL
jgi:aspartyl-tRNA(Asn)/glutamyl-tRNA(Gln) amidotransferase subunit A